MQFPIYSVDSYNEVFWPCPKKICIMWFYVIGFQCYANFLTNFFISSLTCVARISLYAIFWLPRSLRWYRDFCENICILVFFFERSLSIIYLNLLNSCTRHMFTFIIKKIEKFWKPCFSIFLYTFNFFPTKMSII